MNSRSLKEFAKRKDYLICVDSDGCAMDTMDIKHKKCFGPYLVKEWGLEKWEYEILERWYELNLYSVSRGINRFKGLAIILAEVNEKITEIDGIGDLLTWVENTTETSNASLKREIERTGSQCLKKALSWSLALNRAIDGLSDEQKKPFEGVKETLEKMHAFADVAIVSSANNSAVIEEWTKYGLINSVDVIMTQEDGSKAHCIKAMKEKGYGEGKVMMVGDADGDCNAAKLNGVYFYPILVKHEAESWKKLNSEALGLFKAGLFDGTYAKNLIKEFYENLGA